MSCLRVDPRARPSDALMSCLLSGLLCLLLSACGDTENVAEVTLERLELTPLNPTVRAEGEAAALQFSVRAFWSDGAISEGVNASYRQSNQNAGSLSSDGYFVPRDDAGGITLITASWLGREARSQVTVQLEQVLREEGIPESLVSQLDAAEVITDDTQAPTLLYPFDQTIVPRNIARFDVQWRPAEGKQLTILELESPTCRTRVLSLSDRWLPSAQAWASLAVPSSGGELTLRISSAEVSGEGASLTLVGPIYAHSELTTVGISRLDTTGAIYYWSISDRGLKRISIDTQLTQDFFIPTSQQGGCVSCHTLSPSGQRMALVYPDPEGGARLGLLGLEPNRPPTELVSFADDVASSRGTFSPDEQYFVSTERGEVLLFEGRTGTFIRTVDLGFQWVANPSFSPSGDELVFAVPSSFIEDTRFYDARIAAVPFDDGDFGQPYWVTSRAEGYNQYNPTYSPDGAWIAFNQSRSYGTNDPEGDTLMDQSSEIWLVKVGGGAPIQLKKLSAIDETRLGAPGADPVPTLPDGSTGYAASLPVWGPLPDADLLWLSFSSLRGFGHTASVGTPQIWLSAIEPSKAERGEDPSHPPFWLPLQDPSTHNHIPQWGPY